jgi:hypothetical protein
VYRVMVVPPHALTYGRSCNTSTEIHEALNRLGYGVKLRIELA